MAVLKRRVLLPPSFFFPPAHSLPRAARQAAAASPAYGCGAPRQARWAGWTGCRKPWSGGRSGRRSERAKTCCPPSEGRERHTEVLQSLKICLICLLQTKHCVVYTGSTRLCAHVIAVYRTWSSIVYQVLSSPFTCRKSYWRLREAEPRCSCVCVCFFLSKC